MAQQLQGYFAILAQNHIMRKLLIIICIAFCSCKKTPSASVITVSSRWVPNMYAVDTLTCSIVDTTGLPIGVDTITTLNIGDTTCLMYHGTKLYIWILPTTIDTFKNNQNAYIECYINTIPLDTTGSWAGGKTFCSAQPSKFIDESGNPKHQFQSIWATNKGIGFKKHSTCQFTSIILH